MCLELKPELQFFCLLWKKTGENRNITKFNLVFKTGMSNHLGENCHLVRTSWREDPVICSLVSTLLWSKTFDTTIIRPKTLESPLGWIFPWVESSPGLSLPLGWVFPWVEFPLGWVFPWVESSLGLSVPLGWVFLGLSFPWVGFSWVEYSLGLGFLLGWVFPWVESS